MSKGAANCGVSQSAASQHVHEVEKRLGVTLLDRAKRPLELTAAGQAYADFCRDTLRREDELRVRLESLKRDGIAAAAQLYLGDLYGNGQGVGQDYVQAVAWFRKAAEQNNAQAQFNLGLSYAKGYGVTQSYWDAYFWLNLAAARNKGKDREAFAKSRDEAATKLSADDLSKAQQKAAEWFAAHSPQQ